MDIKVNNVQQAMPVEQTAQLQETDGTFKFRSCRMRLRI